VTRDWQVFGGFIQSRIFEGTLLFRSVWFLSFGCMEAGTLGWIDVHWYQTLCQSGIFYI